MGWSTREIAELADTTVRAVRHYHDVGLLEEPERRSNGYKQYGVAHMLRGLRSDPCLDEFDDLPADADEDTRRSLAERLLPYVRDLYADHPRLMDVSADAPGGEDHANRTMGRAMRDLYNPAQLDVIRRTHLLFVDAGPVEPR